MIQRGISPDVVTDQTSAHDPLNGYLPKGWTLEKVELLRKTDPQTVINAAMESMAVHVRAMLNFHRQGIPVAQGGSQQGCDHGGLAQLQDQVGRFAPVVFLEVFPQGIEITAMGSWAIQKNAK